jgi:hypothetical protein
MLALQSKTSLKNNYFGEGEQQLTKMQHDIDRLQAQQKDNQKIYNTLMNKTKAKMWRKIKEVEDGDAVKDDQPKQPVEIRAEPEPLVKILAGQPVADAVGDVTELRAGQPEQIVIKDAR